MTSLISAILEKIPADVRAGWGQWIMSIPEEHREEAISQRYAARYGGSVEAIRAQLRDQESRQSQQTTVARDVAYIDRIREKNKRKQQLLQIAAIAGVSVFVGYSFSKTKRRKN